MLTDEKAQKREERRQREIEKFKANIAIPRPGTGSTLQETLPVLEKHGVELSDILYLSLTNLRENPLNDYPPLPEDELEELTQDIRDKGILVPLIVKLDGTIVCGHNRKVAGLRAGVERAPVQQILSSLSAALEKDIMKSENDRRRGGRWSKEQKEKFIQENFKAALTQDNRGGDRKSDQKLNSPLIRQSSNVAREIATKSRGRISQASAKQLVANMRKKTSKKPDSGSASLPARDRRRGEKLALNIRTLREAKAILEKKLDGVKEQEKALLTKLKSIGHPHLFGL